MTTQFTTTNLPAGCWGLCADNPHDVLARFISWKQGEQTDLHFGAWKVGGVARAFMLYIIGLGLADEKDITVK